ncbi:MAG TPA: amino acid adenylation domain-containing protein [Solirubrobacteraceae bacterium]|nr:amino acid adenylation domain-containing protein [Solirubrobacteraceae bacterium]
MVVNTVALRVDMRGEPTARELTQRAQAVVMEAQNHQDVPFEQVVEHLAPQRRADVSPLYQTLFSFHDAPVHTIAMAGASLIPTDALPNGSAKIDLSLTVIRRRGGQGGEAGFEQDVDGYERIAEDGLTLVWEYNSDLFEAHTAQRMIDHYVRLLEQFVGADGDGTAALSLPLEEQEQLEPRVAGPRGGYERDATIAQVFEARVAERPEATALSCEGRELSYRQLDRHANRLAHRLRSLGVDRGARAAICMDRSIELIVTMLAIAKCGAAYVPFDPRDPKQRLAGQLAALDVPLLLSRQLHRDTLPETASRLLFVDDELDLAREPDSAPPQPASATDPAYLMFTSGSTGTPSAVVVPHRAIVRLVRDADYVRLGPQETLLAMAPNAFDASTFEVWGALLNGARLALAPAGPLALADLAGVVQSERVTTMWLTAGLFHRVVDDRPELLGSIRQLLAGGDVLSADHARRALASMPPGATLANGYGPTETTTFACVHVMRAGDRVEQPVPIGRPISGSRAYILDSRREPVPPGVGGELYVGGDGVALGYADDPRRTAERYTDDPFDATPGGRMYRTGDLARWREDRTIEFLGRADRQLKIRGFRIEPGEVEAALREHPGVADAVVSAVEDAAGGLALAAHVVPAGERETSDAELRAHLARTLPAHAVPGAWGRIEQLPLTHNGKVDLAALPPLGTRAQIGSSGSRQESGDELERRLIDLWRRTLDLDAIGPDDDFFDLGGHSLLAVELFAAIERSLGIALPLASIFEAPTVRQMASCLREEGWRKSPDSLVRLTATGARPPLFFVAAGDGNSVGFGALARRLGPEQPFYALQPRGMNGRARLHGTVESMAAHYVREIRHIAPDGPYLLGGRCLGAVVAYEMARLLERGGREVALLAVLDSGGPLWQTRLLADGTPFDEVMSGAIRRGSVDVELAEAFTPTGTERLLGQLAEPVCTGADGTIVNRYLHEIYLKRADVRDAYPDLTGEDAMWFVGWAWTSGREQMGLSERLLPAAANPEWEVAAKKSRREQLDAFRKRAAWRVAEALDLATAGRRDGAAARRAERVRELSLQAWHQHRAGAYKGVVTLIRSEEFELQPGLERWHFLDSGGVEEHHVRGTHRSMLREPDVESLAACVKELVDERVEQMAARA